MISYLKYQSILYDSQTFKYINSIGQTIYILEREFRNLIEIKFLSLYGENWSQSFFPDNDKLKSKKNGRDSIFENLDNPLDDLDFIKLKEVLKNIITKKSGRNILDEIIDLKKLVNTSCNSAPSEFEEISDLLLKSIKKFEDHFIKKTDYKFEEIFYRITPDLKEQWEELYNIRNLWAHNNCLITSKEHECYINMLNEVLNLIRIELTLFTFFNTSEEIKYTLFKDSKLELEIYKHSKQNKSYCLLKGKITVDGISYSLSKDDINYVLFYELFNFFTETNEENQIIPFFLETQFDLNKDKILSNIDTFGKDKIIDQLKRMNILYSKINLEEESFKEDMDKYLEAIFKG